MASKLGLGPTDIRKKLNAKNEPFGFLGAQDKIATTGDVLETIEEKEERALGRLNARHFEMTTYISGEMLTKAAKGTETAFTVGLFPASNLQLYLDYQGIYAERTPCDTLDEDVHYTFNGTTGLITLTTPIRRGANLIAEYDHQALSKCLLLRDIVKDLVAVEWARRLYPDDESFARYLEWERQAYSDLARLRKKDGEKLGIKMFDDISRRLIDPTQEPRSVNDAYDADGGCL
jgi:hypothetical protein